MSPSTTILHGIASLALLASVACERRDGAPPGPASGPVPARDAAPPSPTAPGRDAAPPSPTAPAALADWTLDFASQEFGAAVGPKHTIRLAATGAISMTQDHLELDRWTVSPVELEPIGRILASPELAALEDSPLRGEGRLTTLVITSPALTRTIQLAAGNPSAAMTELNTRVGALSAARRDAELAAIGAFTLRARLGSFGPDTEIVLDQTGRAEQRVAGKPVGSLTIPRFRLDRIVTLLRHPDFSRLESVREPNPAERWSFELDHAGKSTKIEVGRTNAGMNALIGELGAEVRSIHGLGLAGKR